MPQVFGRKEVSRAALVGGVALTLSFGCTTFNDEPAPASSESPAPARIVASPGTSARPGASGTSTSPTANPTGTTTAPTTPPGPPITIIPAGTIWSKESVHPIRWTMPTNLGPLDPTITLVESIDRGATWTKVAEVTSVEGYYRCVIPAAAAQVRYGVELHLTSDTGVIAPKGRLETIDVAISASQKKDYDWVKVANNAPFGPRDGAGGIVHNGKMWLIGGWNPERFPLQTANDVWSSVDGATWVQEKQNTFLNAETFPATDWEGRHFAGYHSYDGKMWIVGGDPNQGYYQTDVWSSIDGQAWTRTDLHTVEPRIDARNGLPFPPGIYRPVETAQYGLRTAHITGTFLGRMFLMGGQRMNEFVDPTWPGAAPMAFNDVWWSVDGASFGRVTTTGPVWRPRGYVSEAVELNSQMWLVGGGLSEDPTAGRPTREYFNDVWSTSDGANWAPTPTEAPFSPRIWHNVKAFDGRVWVINGYDGSQPGQGRIGDNLADVWYSTDGVNWYEASPPTTFVARHAGTAWVHNGALFVGSGNAIDEEWYADVWRMTPRPVVP